VKPLGEGATGRASEVEVSGAWLRPAMVADVSRLTELVQKAYTRARVTTGQSKIDRPCSPHVHRHAKALSCLSGMLCWM
jgi:hypothetical protein